MFIGLFSVPGYAASIQLTVGQGSAWVREEFPPSGARDVTQLVWTHPPPGLDVSSLQVWSLKKLGLLQQWRQTQIGRDDAIIMDLAAPMPHRMGHSLAYRLEGWNWNVRYEAMVEASEINPQMEATATVRGVVEIQKPVSAIFSDAQVSLMGVDTALLPPADSGFVDIRWDSPMADVFRNPPELDPVPQMYNLQQEISLGAAEKVEVAFLNAQSLRAAIWHEYHSEMGGDAGDGDEVLLNRILRVSNVDLGEKIWSVALPPGQGWVRLSNAFEARMWNGHVPQTGVSGELRLPMGVSERVRASRKRGFFKTTPDGNMEMEFSIIFQNQEEATIRVEVEEIPDTPLEWSLIRSTHSLRPDLQRLRGTLEIPPHTTEVVTYRILLRPPPE